MRANQKTEQAFYQTLAHNTTTLLEDTQLSVKQKVETIERAVSENSRRLTALKAARQNASDANLLRRFDRFIAMREKATRYLLSTSTWLIAQTRVRGKPLPKPDVPTVGDSSASS